MQLAAPITLRPQSAAAVGAGGVRAPGHYWPATTSVQKHFEILAGVAFGDLATSLGVKLASTSLSEQDLNSVATNFW